MEGLDVGEQDRFGRPRSSPPGSRSRIGRPVFGPEMRPRSSGLDGVGEVGVWERYASAVLSSGEEDDDDDEAEDESSSEEDGEESGSDGVDEDVEMGDGEAEKDEEDELALFGHR